MEFDKNYSNFLVDHILKFIKEFNINKIDAVSSHGHTVFHKPDKHITFQLGNLSFIAEKITNTFICDFRTQDLALGGQGAPLVPIGDKMLFNDYDACLNLGGFSNLSKKNKENIIAYDICALNVVLNKLANKLNLKYDQSGNNAQKGKIIKPFYHELEKISFYNLDPPKSLGVEWVYQNIFKLLERFDNNAICDLLHTYTVHAANQIVKNLNSISRVLVTGGGTYNSFLISEISNKTNCNLIIPDSSLVEFKEAMIFAFLGLLKMRGESNVLSSVTGAARNHSSGKIFSPK